MAVRFVRIGSMNNVHVYDDADYDAGVETDGPMKAGEPAVDGDVLRKGDVPDISAGGLDNSRLVDTNAAGELDSVTNLTDYITAAAQLKATSIAGGKVEIDGNGDTSAPTLLSSIQAGGAGALGIQYKTIALTVTKGIVMTVGAESAWNDI